ncbi:MAG: ShlB/FhaC/HecB family hemolysin secretion/activation protein [Gloeocapsa sp. DLM2.Bin57]|nr:MAG: ShlB/FhaC/HecB family hemolysin secretion/activation protein [Gloeocapsa sp. DLM2.Bin57]
MFYVWRINPLVWLLVLVYQTPIHSQVIPRPVTPIPQPTPEVEVLPPLEDILPPPSREVTPEIPTIPLEIIIEQFEVRGTTVFTSEDLEEILEPYTNRPLSFTELLEIQTAITQLYVDRGYLTSGAFIPPQSLQDGILIIEVIEGEIEEIIITGLERLKPEYIRNRIAINTSGPLNQADLLRALQLLQINPLIESLAAELTRGSQPHLSILKIDLQENPAFSLALGVDNQQSPSVGSNRRLLTINHRNLFGFGDNLYLRYYNTDGSNVIEDFSYLFPINPLDGLIGFRFYYSDSELIQEPLQQLNIDSQSRTYEFIFRQPVFKTPTQELGIGFNLAKEKSELTISPPTINRSLRSETNINIFRLSQEYFIRDQRQIFAVFSQFNLATDAYTLNLDGVEGSSQFVLWRSQAQYFRNLNNFISFFSKVEFQLADSAIPSLEQFALGGVNRGRGYPENAILGDNGVFVSLELRFSLVTIPKANFNLQLVSFYELGHVWNNSDFTLPISTLASVGVGLNLTAYDRLNAYFYWGIPLNNLTTLGNSLQEDGLYFSVQYQVLKF